MVSRQEPSLPGELDYGDLAGGLAVKKDCLA